MSRTLIVSSVALAIALIGVSASAQTPQPPKAVSEAPAMGGEPQTKPGPAVIALRANEVQLSHVANAALMRNETENLGQQSPNLYGNDTKTTAEVPRKIGTLTSAMLDPNRKEITSVGVEAGVAIRSLRFPGRKFSRSTSPMINSRRR